MPLPIFFFVIRIDADQKENVTKVIYAKLGENVNRNLKKVEKEGHRMVSSLPWRSLNLLRIY